MGRTKKGVWGGRVVAAVNLLLATPLSGHC